MVHKRRTWNVKEYDSAEQLADKIANWSWTLCTGFKHRGILYLNDSFSEDGAGEWAAVRESDGVQFESITFGWMKEPEILAALNEYPERQPDFNMGTITPNRYEHGRVCKLCA